MRPQAHTDFLNAYMLTRGDLIAAAEHLGISPIDALDLADHPDIAPKLERFAVHERTRHFLRALSGQHAAADILTELLDTPDRPKSALALARLTVAMAQATKPPKRPGATSDPALRSDVPNHQDAASSPLPFLPLDASMPHPSMPYSLIEPAPESPTTQSAAQSPSPPSRSAGSRSHSG